MSSATIEATFMVRPGVHWPDCGRGIRMGTGYTVVVMVMVLYRSSAACNSTINVPDMRITFSRTGKLVSPPLTFSKTGFNAPHPTKMRSITTVFSNSLVSGIAILPGLRVPGHQRLPIMLEGLN